MAPKNKKEEPAAEEKPEEEMTDDEIMERLFSKETVEKAKQILHENDLRKERKPRQQ